MSVEFILALGLFIFGNMAVYWQLVFYLQFFFNTLKRHFFKGKKLPMVVFIGGFGVGRIGTSPKNFLNGIKIYAIIYKLFIFRGN